MREIGKLQTESEAKLFSDYLYVSGFGNKIEPTADASGKEEWVVWIHSEDQLDEAKALLNEFRTNPAAPKFREAKDIARKKRAAEEKDFKEYKKRFKTAGQVFPAYDRLGPLTTALIGLSVIVALISRLGSDLNFARYLFISEFFGSALAEVRDGQVWRLVTPIFIHFGILHIIFNLLWLRDLGSMIEKRLSTLTLAFLVVVIAVVSNLAQYFMSGPGFGGMSGVVYGLLGYIWIRGKYDFNSGLFIHQQTLMMMIIWFFVGVLGLVGHIANTAHGAGFVTGIVLGYLTAKIAPKR